jgi:hypothetical protein
VNLLIARATGTVLGVALAVTALAGCETPVGGGSTGVDAEIDSPSPITTSPGRLLASDMHIGPWKAKCDGSFSYAVEPDNADTREAARRFCLNSFDDFSQTGIDPGMGVEISMG